MFAKHFPHNHRYAIVAVALFLSLPTIVTAQSKSKAPPSHAQADQSPEMKKNMADMYQKMADCMRTDKSMHDCHKEVMKDCPVAKETGSCPLMDGMGGMMKHGKMKSGMMKDMNMDSSKTEKK